jgi:hypothetical protein
MIVDTPLHVLLETLTVNADVDMRAELPKIQVPALIVHCGCRKPHLRCATR